jgi:hypothetical protein
MFPVFLNAPDVACTVTSDSASRAPYFVGCWEERKAVNFMCLAKVCKEMDKVLGQYLRTRRFAQIANAGESSSPYSSGATGDHRQFTQCGDAIRQRRVCAEQRGQSAAAEPRFHDA